jgi:hypothetical protein
MRDLAQDSRDSMKGAGDQIDHQEQEDGTEPPRVVHIEEVKKVQHLIKANPVSLNIFRTSGILHDQGPDDGKKCKQDEERNGEFERPKKVSDYGKKSNFLRVCRVFGFFHRVL